MVLQRRLDYGFDGYQAPAVPRACRSARGRDSIRKKGEKNCVHAFEVLATVAGSLLQERESSALTSACRKDQHNSTITVKQGKRYEGQLLKLECGYHRSSDENLFALAPELQGFHQSCAVDESFHAQNDWSLMTQRIRFSKMLAIINSKNACGNSRSKAMGESSVLSPECKVEDVTETRVEVEPWKIRTVVNRLVAGAVSPKNGMDFNGKAPASLFRDRKTVGSFPRRQDKIKIVSRDDDENYCGCSQPGTIMKGSRTLWPIGDERRKLSASKYWRVAPNLKNKGCFNSNGKTKSVYCNWKTSYTRQRPQKISPLVRRKLLDRSMVPASKRGLNCEGLHFSSDKIINGDNIGAAQGASSSVAGEHAATKSRDCNVKLSIKSFRIPELFVEIPATATIGSLKRTVMEAATAMLGDGLHVGILVQGKKVKDDSKTLLQTGISQYDKLHSLGFMLEPRNAEISPPLCSVDPSFSPPGGTCQRMMRYLGNPTLESGASNVSPAAPMMNVSGGVERVLTTVSSAADIAAEKMMLESRELVAVPAKSVELEALAVVPFHWKSRHPKFVPRRIRRPFSVSEVEALVQAVEKLGTGRWRDVKLHVFDGANHRTYVDLKDKWKTLVHTARISPQQRRGEPLPQELLDRVLAAHTYWSQQQGKQQVMAAV